MKHCLGGRHWQPCCLECWRLVGWGRRWGTLKRWLLTFTQGWGLNHVRKNAGKSWESCLEFSLEEARVGSVCCVWCVHTPVCVLLTLLVPWTAAAMPLESLEIPVFKSKASWSRDKGDSVIFKDEGLRQRWGIFPWVILLPHPFVRNSSFSFTGTYVGTWALVEPAVACGSGGRWLAASKMGVCWLHLHLLQGAGSASLSLFLPSESWFRSESTALAPTHPRTD